MSIPFGLHLATDLAATSTGSLCGYLFYRHALTPAGFRLSTQRDPGYLAWLAASALIGAFWFGTANLYFSGISGIGRSAFGAIFGGICGVEIRKLAKGQSGSTGVVFVVPLCVGMLLGRFGCLFAGMHDFTYGVPTSLPWAVDFGDGIPRHPAPLYESLAMTIVLTGFLLWFRRAPEACARTGFPVFTAAYAVQRFCIEFTKPYGEVVAGLNVFQIGALLMLGYAAWMLRRYRASPARIHA
ncbi:MAG: prolipoprotein diacylglyceryl transferase [Pseudomonadales bacterium]|nr:prolipoprotein diacylglyceryl transferase [Pseudomonadales bacterium]MCP5183285.1 prolipoprotein diacylglyceryl transferase [Pseudomonadales bacterium]